MIKIKRIVVIVKKIFGELINLLAAALLVLCLLTSGYLIFANVYHSKMLSYKYNLNNAELEEHAKYVNTVTSTSLDSMSNFISNYLLYQLYRSHRT